MARREIDTGDIQAIAKTAFGWLKGASYMLLRVGDPRAARRWLRDLAPARLARLSAEPLEDACQIAFTAAGLRALGIDDAIVKRFSPEFVEGIASDENRSRRLGDIGANAPSNWHWGVGDREPHILLILLSSDFKRHKAFADQMQMEAQDAGLSLIAVLPTSDMSDVEPFGFADGISQPNFDWDRQRMPGTKADRDYTNLLALGELLLGHRNEYGLLTERPLLAASEKNSAILPKALHPPGNRDLGLNGKPLDDLIRGRSIPGVEAQDSHLNGFLYDTDPDGLSCPIGAHIRRANPRTGDTPGGRQGPIDNLLVMLGLTMRRASGATSSTLPWPRNTTIWPFVRSEDDAIASSRFHRILRRGREYGTKIERNAALDPATPDPQSGIHFVCLNANIARQFEFVQSAWIASAKFAALTGEQDPLLGNREPFPTTPIAAPQPTDGFSRPGAPPHCRHSTGLPQFVNVRGGGYFFLPGLSALKWIASD